MIKFFSLFLLLHALLISGVSLAEDSSTPNNECNKKLEEKLEPTSHQAYQRDGSAFSRAWAELKKSVYEALLKLPGSGLSDWLVPRLGSDLKATNHELLSELAPKDPDVDAPGSGKKRPYLSIDRSPVPLFRGKYFQDFYFFQGYSQESSELDTEDLKPGVKLATLRIQNRLPGVPATIFVPADMRPLPSSQQPKGVRVWVSSTGEFRFLALSTAKLVDIYLTDEIPAPLTSKELRLYTQVHNPVLIENWPEPFGSGLKIFLEKISNASSYTGKQKAQIVGMFIKQYFQYTYRNSPSANAIEIAREGKLQCTWAANLWVGIVRQYLGMPARVAIGFPGQGSNQQEGYSFITDTNIGHAWGEVYNFDTQRWESVDPTPSNVVPGEKPNEQEDDKNKNDYYNFSSDHEWNADSEFDLSTFFNFSISENFPGLPDLPAWLTDWFNKKKQPHKVEKNKVIPAEALLENEIIHTYLESMWISILRQVLSNKSNSISLYQSLLYFVGATAYGEWVNQGDVKQENQYIMPAWAEFKTRARSFFYRVLILLEPFGRFDSFSSLLKQKDKPDIQKLKLTTVLMILEELKNFTKLTKAEAELYKKLINHFHEAKSFESDSDLFEVDSDLPKEKDWSLTLNTFVTTQFLKQLLPDPPQVFVKKIPLYNERTRISNQEMDLSPVQNLQDWSKFHRAGWVPPYDLFRAFSGNLDQRLFEERSPKDLERFYPPQELIIVDTKVDFVEKDLDLIMEKSLVTGVTPLVVTRAGESLKVLQSFDEIKTISHPSLTQLVLHKLESKDLSSLLSIIQRFPTVTRVQIYTDNTYTPETNDKRFESFKAFLTENKIAFITHLRVSNYSRPYIELKEDFSSNFGFPESWSSSFGQTGEGFTMLTEEFTETKEFLNTVPNVHFTEEESLKLSELMKDVESQGSVFSQTNCSKEWHQFVKLSRLIDDPPDYLQNTVDWKCKNSKKISKECDYIRSVQNRLSSFREYIFASNLQRKDEIKGHFYTTFAKHILGIPLSELVWSLKKNYRYVDLPTYCDLE